MSVICATRPKSMRPKRPSSKSILRATCPFDAMWNDDLGVSLNGGYIPPNHPLKNRVFPYKPSILGYPYFWKHPSDIIPLKEKTGELQRGNVKYKSGHNSPIFINLQLVLDVWTLQRSLWEIMAHLPTSHMWKMRYEMWKWSRLLESTSNVLEGVIAFQLYEDIHW